MKQNVRLDDVLKICGGPAALVIAPRDLTSTGDRPFISGLAADSRKVQPGNIFVALEGTEDNGENYISAAIQKGASTIVARKEICKNLAAASPTVRFIGVDSPRQVLGWLAAFFYSDVPAHLMAVTGTSGKTSIVEFTRQLFQSVGLKAASIGTLGVRCQGLTAAPEALLTTPATLDLYPLLEDLKHHHVDYVAFEASSHGLDQYRLDGLSFQAAAFTNLSHDHLDYHGTFAHYLQAKCRLFSELLATDGTAVLNADVPEYNQLVQSLRGQNIISYGKGGAELRLNYIDVLPDYQKVSLEIFGKSYTTRVPLVGRFQVSNVLAALGLSLSVLGVDYLEALLEKIPLLVPAPGRMQLVGHHRGAAVYVDYSHKPDALKTVLEMLRHHTPGRLHVVFGCGGNRDKTKRPLMGAIATQLADHVIVTDDNPRYEEAAQIRKEILATAPRAQEIGDRRAAIATAIEGLRQGDVLVVAGKGHETGQKIGDRMLPFDDATVILEAMGADR